MNWQETRILYEQHVSHEPDDPVVYGEKVAELVVPKGWVSPNYIYGTHWSRTRKWKQELEQAVKAHILQLKPDQRSKAVLSEPRPRVLRLTAYQTTGRLPDVDNLVGGFKCLIDALKRVKYTFKSSGLNQYLDSINSSTTGNGLIWDDEPKWLRIAEVHCKRQERGTKNKVNYVHVEVFEWPEEE